jgi:hypothetical protein
MTIDAEQRAKPEIVGRSSSHFTRVTRIFAAELGVDYSLCVVHDLMSTDPREYAGNPALKLPAFRAHSGVWFGALNICRELARLSGQKAPIVWPEDLDQALAANAQELVLHAMATEVNLILANAAQPSSGNAHVQKMEKSLKNTMSWLNENAESALAALPPDRALSYFETTLFCLVTHLEFRGVLPTRPYAALNAFTEGFSARASASSTVYRFDA